MEQSNNVLEERCSKCKNRDMATVPFFVYEGTAYRFERSQKALIIVTIIALILSCIVVIGAIVMAKLMSDMVAVYDAKEVVQNIANSARI